MSTLTSVLVGVALCIIFGLSTAFVQKWGEKKGYDKGFIAGAKCQVQEVSPGVFEIVYVDPSQAKSPKKKKTKQPGGG